jgi:ABC-type sugar transport system ATPase subunit
LRELFSRLNQTIIYVTHDQTEAMTLADEIALMNDGRIDQMAPPRELYNESASRFSGWFLGNPGMGFVTVANNRETALVIAGGHLPDDAATLGFRPEHVKLSAADSTDGVPATVRHVAIATGGQVLVNLRSGELAVKAKLPWNSTMDIRAGTEVKWSVDSSRVRMFGSDDSVVSTIPLET